MIVRNNKVYNKVIRNNTLIKSILRNNKEYLAPSSAWWEEYCVRALCLKSDGSAYIDTSYKLQYDNGRTELAVSVDNTDTATSIYGFIERSGNLANRISIGSTGTGFFVGSGNTIYLEQPSVQGKKYVLDWNRKTEKVVFNGVELDAPRQQGLVNTYSAFLFSRNDNGSPDANGIYNLEGYVYYLREWLDDEIKIDLIPTQVAKQFTDNNGVTHNVGDWIFVSNLVNKEVPPHYGTFSGLLAVDVFEEIESIKSDGRQYIDTGVYGDETTELGFEFALSSLVQQKIAGSRTSANSNNITFSYPTNANNNFFNIDFQNNAENRLATSNALNLNVFYTAIASPTLMSIDGTEQSVKNITPFLTPTTLRIFDGYGLTYASQMMIGEARRYWIKKNNILIQECVASRLLIDYDGKSAGTVGAWNKIDNSFFESSTATPFVAVEKIRSNLITSDGSMLRTTDGYLLNIKE